MDAFDAFQFPFMQRAALEVVLLAPLAGLLGAQIVLRQLAFYTHGVGTATFPGLVIAGPAGLSPLLCAAAVALFFAGALDRLSRSARLAFDAATALLLVALLAIGVILASDVFDAGAQVDQLLFGSLLAIGNDELVATAVVLAVAGLVAARFRRAWVAGGFETASSRSLGLRMGLADWALLGLIAIAVVAALDAIGALLVGSILVIPAATARLVAPSVRSLEVAGAAIALVEGLAGLVIAYELDVPPGATIATLGGIVFAVVAIATRSMPRTAQAHG
jgi:manganese/iron transport system permease protein